MQPKTFINKSKTMDLKNITNLLHQVNTISKYNKELARLNGENFNIFSILGMESDENKTHSRFIAELLNPKGSHDLGAIFLELFLKQIDLNTVSLDSNNTNVFIEKSIGKTNYLDKSGGRIDIALIDDKNHSIYIENKIYANDQNAQIERYYNHNTDKSTVLYLTLLGNEPTQKSKGNLVSGTDFHCISYKYTIVEWLEKCVKEASTQPVLRETIKQYIILINKLTGQLTNQKMEEDVIKLIQANFESASLINSNFDNAKFSIAEKVRNRLFQRFEVTFSEKYRMIKSGKISDTYAKIMFYPISYQDLGISISIESFSGNGHHQGKLFIGFLDIGDNNRSLFSEFNVPIWGWWRNLIEFNNFEGLPVSFKDINLLQLLINEEKAIDNLVETLFSQTKNYIDENEFILLEIYKKLHLITQNK